MGKFDWFSHSFFGRQQKEVLIFFIAGFFICYACTKDVGKNPLLAYSDAALLDSCKQTNFNYYQNSQALLPQTGPHGPHTLRFNSVAHLALGSDGKLPIGKTMPEGAMIVKDVYLNGQLNLYAFMYKRSGSWMWGEIEPNGNVHFSVNGNVSICTNCHSGVGNRDYVLSFK